MLRVNLLGAAAFARAVGRALVEAGGGGRIVNLSSIAGLTGLPNIGPYNASKAALDALTRTLAVELGPAGVLCNSVAPGTIATEMVEGLMVANPALRERLVAKSPLGRIGHRGRGGLADRLPAHRRRQLHHRPDPAWSTAGAWPPGRRRAGRRLRRRHGRLRRRGAPLARTRPSRSCCSRSAPTTGPGAGRPSSAHSHRIIKETHDWGYLARAGRLAAHRPRAPRPGGGGLVGHQRGDRPARPPRALRRVGRAGRRLRLGELAAVVPRDRARPRLRRRALARRRRADRDLRYPRPGWLELQERFAEAAARRRPRVGRRPQRPRRARDRPDPAQHGRRRPPDPGRPLPRPGPGAAQPDACAAGRRSSTGCGSAAAARPGVEVVGPGGARAPRRPTR